MYYIKKPLQNIKKLFKIIKSNINLIFTFFLNQKKNQWNNNKICYITYVYHHYITIIL